MVADAAGRPSFGLLQHRINLTKPADIERAAKAYPAQLMLFDILELNGQSLIKKTYQERRAILENLVPPEPGSLIQVPPIFDGDLQAALQTSDQLQLEGVVAKRRSSIYQPGRRTHTWLKIKLHRAQEVVIGGWREGQGRRGGGVGSLLMGIPTEAGLHYVGRVGSGFNDRQLDEIQAKLEKLSRKTSPFLDVPREDARDAHWVTPSLVGEVTYGELTEPGRLRHPVWRGLRPDKSPDEVVWEEPWTLGQLTRSKAFSSGLGKCRHRTVRIRDARIELGAPEPTLGVSDQIEHLVRDVGGAAAIDRLPTQDTCLSQVLQRRPGGWKRYVEDSKSSGGGHHRHLGQPSKDVSRRRVCPWQPTLAGREAVGRDSCLPARLELPDLQDS